MSVHSATLAKEATPRPLRAYGVFGELAFLALFVTYLAGRYSLTRLDQELPNIDLRWLALAVLAVLIGMWQVGGRATRPTAHIGLAFCAFSLWTLWMMASAVWSPLGADPTSMLEDLLILLLLSGMAAYVLNRLPQHSLSRIWVWNLLAAFIYFIGAIAAGPGLQGRYSAFGGGPNVFVRVMILGLIAAVYFVYARKTNWPLAFIPLFAVGALLSGSRGGIAAAALVAMFGVWPLLRRLGPAKTVGGLSVVIAGAIALNATMNGAIYDYVEQRYVQQTLIEGYTSTRDVLAETALRLFAESPLIGTGVGGYAASEMGVRGIEYPHNIVLATLAEGGAIGALLLVASVATPFILLRRRGPLSMGTLIAATAGIFIFGAAQFSGDYYDARLMWFFLFYALAQATADHRAKQTAPEPVLR